MFSGRLNATEVGRYAVPENVTDAAATYHCCDPMGRSIEERQQRLYTAIDEVLHFIWDPIGVAGVPQARAEYHSYVPAVFGILERGGDEGEVTAYLSAVASDGMGLSGSLERARNAASVLVEWRDSIAGESAERPIGRLGSVAD